LHGLLYGRPGEDHARHEHAPSVDKTALLLVCLILAEHDRGSDICMRTRNGRVTNTGYFHMGGKQFCFTYFGHSKMVVRAGNFSGPTLAEFDDTMTTNEVKAKFAELPTRAAAA
jgi:hypothetical protein